MSITFEVLKELSKDTCLVSFRNTLCVFKRIAPEDIEIYNKLMNADCPNLAKITEIVKSDDNRIYAVREYIQGITIEQAVQDGKIFTTEEATQIAIEIANGLMWLHSREIIHRDISPNNIVIGNEVKIIDYGISRIVKENKARDTQILGTQGFAAPEQFGFSQSGQTADIYALGVLINYMLTGKLVYQQLCEGPMRKIVLKCTQLDPDKRYQNVKELVNDLKGKGVKNVFRNIIGFRTNKLHKKIIATIFYILAIMVSIGMATLGINSYLDVIAAIIYDILGIWAPFLLAMDFLYWSKKLMPNSTKGERIALRIFLAVISELVGVILMGIIPQL